MLVKLKVMHGASAGKEIKIPKAEFLVGRGDECHLRPKSDAISRRHCVLVIDEAQVLVRDLGSRNGTFVNGDRIEGDRVLKVGDHLKIGPLEFEVLIDHGLGGDKRPKVATIAEAAERTSDSSVVDTDVGAWLSELDEIDKVRKASDPDTRQFKLAEDESVAMTDLSTTELSSTGERANAKDAPAVDEKKKEKEKKKEPGKLPRQAEAASANSRDAAADMLKKFFNRR